jgi:hypothetical protein
MSPPSNKPWQQIHAQSPVIIQSEKICALKDEKVLLFLPFKENSIVIPTMVFIVYYFGTTPFDISAASLDLYIEDTVFSSKNSIPDAFLGNHQDSFSYFSYNECDAKGLSIEKVLNQPIYLGNNGAQNYSKGDGFIEVTLYSASIDIKKYVNSGD